MLCPKCGNPVEEGDRFCLNCGAPVAESAPEPQQVAPATSLQPQPKMGWFKFLIYFSLFAAAVLNVVNAIQLLTGSHYGNTIINLIYYFAAGSIVSFEVLAEASSNVITNAVVSIVMIIINVTYFGKRKHLFVNP